MVVLAGLGVAVFLLYPRIPTIKVGKPFFPGGAFGLQYNISSRGTVDTITYPISVNFTVDSQNYIDIACSEITVKVTVADLG